TCCWQRVIDWIERLNLHWRGLELSEPYASLGRHRTRLVLCQIRPDRLGLRWFSSGNIVLSCGCLVLGLVRRKSADLGGQFVLLSCGREVLQLLISGGLQDVNRSSKILWSLRLCLL